MKMETDGSVEAVELECRRRKRGIQTYPVILPSTNPIGVMNSNDSKSKVWTQTPTNACANRACFLRKQILLEWKYDVRTCLSSATYTIDFNWARAKNYIFCQAIIAITWGKLSLSAGIYFLIFPNESSFAESQ